METIDNGDIEPDRYEAAKANLNNNNNNNNNNNLFIY